MTHPLLRLTASALGALVLCAAAAQAQAAPVTARFSGSVTGYEHGFLDPAAVAYDNDHPVGTAVNWDLSFDDSFLGLPLNDLDFAPRAATGSLQVGSARYTLDGFSFFSLGLEPDFTTIRSYRPQVRGTGPGTSDGGDFFSMFFSWGTDLSLTDPPMIGYGYSNSFSTTYGYLVTSGDYRLDRGGSVPEPATALLALPALAWVARRRRA